MKSFYISQNGICPIYVTKFDEKGKMISYASERMRNAVHFPEISYTSDIIW